MFRWLLLLGIVCWMIILFRCEKNPTLPEPITTEELAQIPFEKLTGRIAFRRLLPDRPDEYFFILLDAAKRSLTDVGYSCPNIPTNLSLSPSADQILFSYYVLKGEFSNFLWQIYTINLATEKFQNVAPSFFDDSYGAWSPDGKKISFWSNRDQKSSIWLVDLEQDSTYFLVAVAERARTRCAWQPDGKRLLFADSDSSGRAELWFFNLETTEVELLIESLAEEEVVYKHPNLSFDGEQLVFVKSFTSGHDEIWWLNLTNKQCNQVTTGYSDWHPCWSPLADRILFSRGNHLFLIKPDGSELEQVTYAASTDEFPSWIP